MSCLPHSNSTSDRGPGRLSAGLRTASIVGIAGWISITVFYGAVVIPTAHDVMGSHREIGFVTRQITSSLNALGSAVTVILLVECIVSWRRRSRGKRIALSVSGGVILTAQIVLILLRAVLDGFLDAETMTISNPDRFGFLHERYLNLTTVLVLAATAHVTLLLFPADPSGRDR